MGNGFSLVIPGDPAAELSKNKRRRLHWRAEHRLTKKWRLSAWCEWYSLGAPRITPPVELHFVVYRGRRLDDDGLLAALSPLRDALWGNGDRRCPLPGPLASDAAAQIARVSVTQVTGSKHIGSETVLMEVCTAAIGLEKQDAESA